MQGNSGVQNFGGSVNISNSAVGSGAAVYTGTRSAARDVPGERRADIGIITVLSEEMCAMADALAEAGSVRERVHDDGFRCREADIGIGIGRGRLRAVLAQADERGQQSAALAFDRLRHMYAPEFIALVGIAGGIHPDIRSGDVVVAQEIIYYDMRKETAGRTFRRGKTRPVPGIVRRAMNDFFSRNGEPYHASVEHPGGKSCELNVLPGPIGSGEAVVAHRDSLIREYLSFVNDKTLCLETEAGGFAQAFHEMTGRPAVSGWLVVRGISDPADEDKDDRYHAVAARHAAVILLRMLPALFPEG